MVIFYITRRRSMNTHFSEHSGTSDLFQKISRAHIVRLGIFFFVCIIRAVRVGFTTIRYLFVVPPKPWQILANDALVGSTVATCEKFLCQRGNPAGAISASLSDVYQACSGQSYESARTI